MEVDENTNTLIITDVKENIDAIRELVKLLDQPEPQVEIETRIVIASRSFSRDLGAQLSAGVLEPNPWRVGKHLNSAFESSGLRSGSPGSVRWTGRHTSASWHARGGRKYCYWFDDRNLWHSAD